jgi:hypothetical protein
MIGAEAEAENQELAYSSGSSAGTARILASPPVIG